MLPLRLVPISFFSRLTVLWSFLLRVRWLLHRFLFLFHSRNHRPLFRFVNPLQSCQFPAHFALFPPPVSFVTAVDISFAIPQFCLLAWLCVSVYWVR